MESDLNKITTDAIVEGAMSQANQNPSTAVAVPSTSTAPTAPGAPPSRPKTPVSVYCTPINRSRRPSEVDFTCPEDLETINDNLVMRSVQQLYYLATTDDPTVKADMRNRARDTLKRLNESASLKNLEQLRDVKLDDKERSFR